MLRTQISLTEEQHSRLRNLAAQKQTSMSALIREMVDQRLAHLSTGDPGERARLAIGAFRSGAGDIARNHDDYLDDAFDDGSLDDASEG